MLISSYDIDFIKAIIFSSTCVVLIFGLWTGSVSLLLISVALGIGFMEYPTTRKDIKIK
jgi:hypothetical protein